MSRKASSKALKLTELKSQLGTCVCSEADLYISIQRAVFWGANIYFPIVSFQDVAVTFVSLYPCLWALHRNCTRHYYLAHKFLIVTDLLISQAHVLR